MLGAGGRGERGYENDKAKVLSLNGSWVGLLALALSFAGEDVQVGTGLVYFSWQSENKALVYI